MYKTYGITPYTLKYKTYQDLILDIKNNLYKIPTDIDLIVGIPRSGMVIAYMLGLMLSKRVCSIDEWLDGNFNNVTSTHRIKLNNIIKNILIVDDSILSGKTFSEIKKAVNTIGLDTTYNITYLAIYYNDESYNEYIDIALEKLNIPRLFQWNYLNHIFLQDAAFDIDGVLCKDPTDEENNDEEKYKNFLLNAEPLFIPQHRIPYIITSRLNKYELETRRWLDKNNILYDNLIMLSGYTAEERRKLNLHAKFKAENYSKLPDIQLFIESNRKQAKEISKLTNKLCFCTATDELFGKK